MRAVIPIPNQRQDAAHHRYAAPAESVREADHALGAQGLEILGFYHSHPNAPARPSAYDLDQATWPWFSYLIVSASDGRAEEITSWVPGRGPLAFRSGVGPRATAPLTRAPLTSKRSKEYHRSMASKVLIPTALRPFTGREAAVTDRGAERRRAARSA